MKRFFCLVLSLALLLRLNPKGRLWAVSGCRETPNGLSRQTFAVCRAHSLCAKGAQLALLRAKSRLRRLRSAQRCGARLAA